MATEAIRRWQRLTWVAACAVVFLALPSCAGAPRAGGEFGCTQETCLFPVLMDLSMPEAQKYLRIRRAMAAGFDVQGTSRQFREMYATLASFVGAYGEADRIYPRPSKDGDPVASGHLGAIPAADTVRTLARGTRAVFINESHASGRTRAAIYTLLRPLREEGYGYLALEGLTTKPAAGAASCSDADLFDDGLAARGYPSRKSGFYTREPVFAEIIREAIRLGFKLVAYEGTDPAATSMEAREQGMARNLACIFERDAKAKVLAVAGFGHVAEAADSIVPGGMMAARFKALTGIDPLSIDTTTLLHAEVAPFRFGNAAEGRNPSQGYALVDTTGHLYGTDSYDLVLLTPVFAGRQGDGHSWLALDGARKRVLAPTGGCGRSRPCAIEAFPVMERGGIPEDVCVLDDDDGACPMFLTRGGFRLEYSGPFGGLGSATLSNPSPP